MRLGISTGLQHDTPAQWASQMKKLGCKSVIFPVDSSASKELVDEYVRQAKDNDLLIAEVGIWRNAIAEDPVIRREAMDYSIAQLRLADDIHAKCCVNITGSAGEIWDGPYRENYSKKTWDAGVRMIQEVIDEVKPVNTKMTIEPMPWMYPSSPEEYARLIEAVDREAFGVHLDAINMISDPQRYFNMEAFLDRCFTLLGTKITSCHLKDVHLRREFVFQLQECDCGEGEFPMEYLVQKMDEVDPKLPLIIEHLTSDEAYYKSLSYTQRRLGLI